MKKILLYGYNGHQNFGDDLLLRIAYDLIKEAGLLISIVTNNPKGVRYLTQWFPKAEIILHQSPGKIFKEFDKVLYIGGNLIFNYEDHPSFLLVLKKLFSSIRLFLIPYWFKRTDFGAISIGVGPFRSKSLEITTLTSLRSFSLVLVRDKKSYRLAKKYLRKRVIFEENPDFCVGDYEELRKIRENSVRSDEIFIVIRNIQQNNINNSYIQNLIRFRNELVKQNKKIVWCSLQKEYDENAMSVIPATDTILQWNPEEMCLKDFYQRFSEASFVITARMHALFVAGMLGIPTIGLRLHPDKFDFAASGFTQNVIVVNTEASADDLMLHYQRLIENTPLFFLSERFKIWLESIERGKKHLQNWVNL